MIIYVDIDETICTYLGDRHYPDAVPIEENINKINDLYDETHEIFNKNFSLLKSAQIYYFKYYLPMVLAKVDQASMFNSVESRAPFLSKKVIRRIIIFCIFFIATRDIIISVVLTAIFIIFIGGIFNDNSKFSLVKKYNPQTKVITRDDVRKAKKIISKYEKQEMKRKTLNLQPSPSPTM